MRNKKIINIALSILLIGLGAYMIITTDDKTGLEKGMGVALCAYGVVRMFMYGIIGGRRR